MNKYRVMIPDNFIDVVADTEEEAEVKVLQHIAGLSVEDLGELLHLISWEDSYTDNIDIQ